MYAHWWCFLQFHSVSGADNGVHGAQGRSCVVYRDQIATCILLTAPLTKGKRKQGVIVGRHYIWSFLSDKEIPNCSWYDWSIVSNDLTRYSGGLLRWLLFRRRGGFDLSRGELKARTQPVGTMMELQCSLYWRGYRLVRQVNGETVLSNMRKHCFCEVGMRW